MEPFYPDRHMARMPEDIERESTEVLLGKVASGVPMPAEIVVAAEAAVATPKKNETVPLLPADIIIAGVW